MVATIIISLLTCISLILSILLFPKITIFKKQINSYWLICLIGGLLIVAFNCISFNEVIDGLTSNASINPIKILILFISMTFISVFLDEIGFLKYLASVVISECKSNQRVLFLMLYALVSVLTIFTSNDIVILTVTPFICYFAKNAKINPIPYLVAEFCAANTWSMMLIIGNPTNIYLATIANINFIEYLLVMILPTIAAGTIQISLMILLFKNTLKQPIILDNQKENVKDRTSLTIALIHLLVCLVLLTISSYISLAMWIICLVCALSLILDISIYYIIKHKNFVSVKNTFKRLPFELIPFVISMFVIVLALNKQGVSSYIGNLLKDNFIILKYGLSSFVSANIMNNIPMSVFFATIPNMTSTIDYHKAIFSTIIGSNIGAFLTPIGALAGIMFTNLLVKHDVKYSFKDFIKYGVIISVPTLLAALIALEIIL